MSDKFRASKVKDKFFVPVPAKPTILQNFRKQLYKSVRIYVLIAQFFGCAPCSAHRPNARPNHALTIAHLSWCVFVFAFYGCSTYFERQMDFFVLSPVQEPLYHCEYIFFLLHAAQIILTTQLYRHRFRSFMERIIALDVRLARFNVKPNYGRLRRFIYQHLCLILLHFILNSLINYLHKEGNTSVLLLLRYITVYMLANIIIQISLVQYYALLYAIALRCIQLNNVLRLELTRHFGSPSTLHRNLQEIRLLYAHLESFTKDINDTFGWSIILVFSGSYINLSNNIFVMYKFVDMDATWLWVFYGIQWCMMHVGKMFLILYYNHCVQSLKTTTASLLSNFRAHQDAMRATVQHFLLQLSMNTRSNVVCGLVTLSLELVTTLLTAVSMLFIFLLQYDITFEALRQAAGANKTT